MRLGVFGGTFDPPHVGHLVLAEQAREQLRLDKLLLIPAGDPWRKSHLQVTPARHRLAMARIAAADNDGFEVDDCEVTRDGPSYTLDTLKLLRRRYLDIEALYLVLGEDALIDLPHWHDPAGIAELALIAVAPRGASQPPLLPFDTSRVVQLDMPAIDISATELRSRLHRGRSLRYLVPDAVLDYIRRERLYLD